MLEADALVSPRLERAPPLWSGEADEVLVCRQVRTETHDVKSFLFSPREKRGFRFKPGQFLTFAFEIDGGAVERCYTISSPPTRPDLVSITVKRVPGGPVSNWLHDRFGPGMEVAAAAPLGRFSMLEHPADSYLFLSGGSGITPLMSMSRSLYDLASGADIVFLHSARSPADIIFRSELELMGRHWHGFRPAFICEADAPHERWTGYRGRLTLPMLRLIAPDFARREIFTCGPAAYMAAVRALLGEADFDMRHYHEESFDFAVLDGDDAASDPSATRSAPTVPRYRIEFTRSRRSIECDGRTTILKAAQQAGMRLPSGCTRGLCGTCKSKLVSGEVDMQHQGGIRQREIDQGQILICCSKPQGDLVIER